MTSEFLYREHPNEHEGQLTKTKSLLVSKAILSRRALAMGLGKYVLMSRSESDSGGRQRLSILADAFESVIGAIYLDQGFEAGRHFIMRWLLRDSREIASDKRHTNYKSHLQEFVQSTYRTHPIYRIRSEVGPDHSKQFNVEVIVGRRVLGTGRGRNKKDAEQAAARDALEQAEGGPRTEEPRRAPRAGGAVATATGSAPRVEREQEYELPREAELDDPPIESAASERGEAAQETEAEREGRRRGRRGARGRRGRREDPASSGPTDAASHAAVPSPKDVLVPVARPPLTTAPQRRPPPPPFEMPADRSAIEVDSDEIGRPEGMIEDGNSTTFARADHFIGGRTVERVGRPSWDDSPSRSSGTERSRPPAFGSINEEAEDNDPQDAPIPLRTRKSVAEPFLEVSAPLDIAPHSPPEDAGESSWAGSGADEAQLPREPAPAPPNPEPASPSFGRKRTRR